MVNINAQQLCLVFCWQKQPVKQKYTELSFINVAKNIANKLILVHKNPTRFPTNRLAKVT